MPQPQQETLSTLKVMLAQNSKRENEKKKKEKRKKKERKKEKEKKEDKSSRRCGWVSIMCLLEAFFSNVVIVLFSYFSFHMFQFRHTVYFEIFLG